MPVLYENPREVGADRIVNAVAAHDRWPQGAIVVDFGTATTFDVVTARGEYLGGVIAPGLTVSADALYHATAKLPRVEIARPPSAVGAQHRAPACSPGWCSATPGLVDAIVGRIKAEVDFAPRVVGTGGLAPLIAARGAQHRRVRRHADVARAGDHPRSQPVMDFLRRACSASRRGSASS